MGPAQVGWRRSHTEVHHPEEAQGRRLGKCCGGMTPTIVLFTLIEFLGSDRELLLAQLAF